VPGTRDQPHTTIAGAGHFVQEDAGEELALGLTVVASALGGSIGAKMWPGEGERAADRR
jgi:hypothetical protein